MGEMAGRGGLPLMDGKPMTSRTSDSLDPTDYAILAILQTEGRLGVTEIGRRVNLSQPAVSARIKRLEQTGVITGYRAVIDPTRLGLNIHAVIRLRTTHARIAACLEHFARVAEITGVRRLTGEDCFLIDIHAADARRLENVVDAIARFGPVTTSLVLRTYPARAIVPGDAPSRTGERGLALPAGERQQAAGSGQADQAYPHALAGRGAAEAVPPGQVGAVRLGGARPGQHDHHRGVRLLFAEYLRQEPGQIPDDRRIWILRDIINRDHDGECSRVPVQEEQHQAS
jgi:Lrp/AsnC family transcriptional regulator, leucine-responsive regulatory protein